MNREPRHGNFKSRISGGGGNIPRLPSRISTNTTPDASSIPAHLALKPTRPDSLPPASRQPQGAIRKDAASAESLQAIRTETASPEPLEAHDQGDKPWAADTSTQLPTRALGSLTSPTRPPGYSNMANGKRRRLRKHDSRQHTNKEQYAEGDGRAMTLGFA
jgi:hypothetical protein